MLTVTRVFDVWYGDEIYLTNPTTGKNEVFKVINYVDSREFWVKNDIEVYLHLDGVYDRTQGEPEDLRWRVLRNGEYEYTLTQLLKVLKY